MNKVLQDINYGMYIVSTKDINSNRNVGCIVNTLVQITSRDVVVSVSINKNNYTNKVLKESKKVAISILSENTSKDVIGKFGYYSSLDTDKFLDIEYKEVDNLPVCFENITGYIIGDVIDIISVDTHDIFLIKVTNTEKVSDLSAMTYSFYHEKLKGVSPKNAPTYVEESSVSGGKKYRCKICGYVYDNSKEEIPFDELPDNWKCPLCGAPKNLFEEI